MYMCCNDNDNLFNSLSADLRYRGIAMDLNNLDGILYSFKSDTLRQVAT